MDLDNHIICFLLPLCIDVVMIAIKQLANCEMAHSVKLPQEMYLSKLAHLVSGAKGEQVYTTRYRQ